MVSVQNCTHRAQWRESTLRFVGAGWVGSEEIAGDGGASARAAVRSARACVTNITIHKDKACDFYHRDDFPIGPPRQSFSPYGSFAYSALACFRMGMLGSAFFNT